MSGELSVPKILIFDIETAPMLGYCWDIWEQNIGLNQIKQDWHVLSWAAKWLERQDGTIFGPHKRLMYKDQRNAKNIEDDKELLRGIWRLLDEADIVITQNGKHFDVKKLYARFIFHGFKPPSSFKHIDTRQIAKSKFGFTSNSLEYMTDKLNTKFKKLKHKEFQGFEMWSECLKGNKAAWTAMEKYNKYDVLSLEELYLRFQPWDNSFNFNLYHDEDDVVCSCGCKEFVRYGYAYTSVGKFQRYQCKKCGAESRSRKNLFDKDKRESLKLRVPK